MVPGRELDVRRHAARLFEAGWGYKAVATELGIKQQTARDWSYSWRAVGTERFCSCSNRHTCYSANVKLAVVHDRLNGVPTVDVMDRYGIPNRNIVKRWVSAYRKHGASAFEGD